MQKRLVVLTGAGISAESGLKTFRDSDGLWENHSIYDVATPSGFRKNPALVLEFYNMRRRDVAMAQPNAAHLALAELQQHFNVQIITQNIDDLHERAGSTNVLHLHGQIFKMRSVRNQTQTFTITGDINLGDLAEDGGQLRPDIVWFDEEVPLIETAINLVAAADIFVVVGTSLLVYPAASLINYAAESIPKFIVDKSIPYTSNLSNLTPFEMSASEGVPALTKQLISQSTSV